jgi:hypothetical protein
VILANQLESRSGTAATALAIAAQFNKMSDMLQLVETLPTMNTIYYYSRVCGWKSLDKLKHIGQKIFFSPVGSDRSNCLNPGQTPLKKTETVTSKVTNFV